MSFPLVKSYRRDASTGTDVLADAEVRLKAGYYLYVDQGPLVIGDVAWYRVVNVNQPGEVRALGWDADGDAVHEDDGWVAGSKGASDNYLIYAELPPDEYAGGSPPSILLHAIGNGRSSSFEIPLGIVVDWYAADPAGATCNIEIRLEPNDILIQAASVDGLGHGERDWRVLDVSGAVGSFWLEVQSDCSWSLQAQQIVG